MNSVHVNSFEKRGKETIYHCTIAGREKSLNKKQLLAAIEFTLPEGPPARQPTSTLPQRNGDEILVG